MSASYVIVQQRWLQENPRKISYSVKPGLLESPVAALPWRNHPQSLLPCLGPSSTPGFLSQERGSKQEDHLKGWVLLTMSKRRWTGPFVTGQQAFFMDFQKYLYTALPLSLNAAQTFSKGQLLPGVELWGDKRLKLVKFPLFFLWRWRDSIWEEEISRNTVSSYLRGMSF